jgi:putative resolvase
MVKLVARTRRQGIVAQDRLALAAVPAAGRRLVVVDCFKMNDDLLQGMIAVLTSFCAQLYGRRSARNRVLSIERALAHQPHS